jgi:N utilization substance protein B
MYYFSTDNEKNEPNLTPINNDLALMPEEIEEDDQIIEFGQPISQRDLRSVAFHLVYAVDRSEYLFSLDEMFSTFNEQYDLGLTPFSFAYTLAAGAIEDREKIDEQIKPFLKNWEFNRLGCCTKLILRMAFWELQQPNITPIIVINEAIELAKGFAEKDAYKFINGLLDEFCKANSTSIAHH